MVGRTIGNAWIRHGNYEKRIKITDCSVELETGTAYPYLYFTFKVDNDIPFNLKIHKITAKVFMASSHMGAIYWERPKIEPQVTADRSHQFDMVKDDRVKDPKAFGESWVTLYFTPPRDALKTKFGNNWSIKGLIIFSCRLGVIPKEVAFEYRISDDRMKTLGN